VLHEIQQKHLTQIAGAQRLKISDRQVRRMLLRLRQRGDHSLVHGLRGRPSNRKLPSRLEQKIVARLQQRYADFGPLRAAEHRAQEGFSGSRETLRKWMDQSGLVGPAGAAREGRACMAGAPSQFRGAADAGQLTLPLVGGARTGLPAHRPDR
jgi:hypothetical protein